MKKFILFALLALLLPSSAWSYDVGEIFTANIGTEESPYYMKFKRIENSYSEVPQCVVFGEEGNPAIDKESEGPNYNYTYSVSGTIRILSPIEGMNVVGISSYAFAECQKIKGVSIVYEFYNLQQEQVEDLNYEYEFSIGENAFYNCTQLRYFRNDYELWFEEDEFDESEMEKINQEVYSKWYERSISIGARAFYNCSSLKGITATSIGKEALAGTNVQHITFTGGEWDYPYISDYAFSYIDGEDSKKSISLSLYGSFGSFEFAKDAFAGCDIGSIYVDPSNHAFGHDYGAYNEIVDWQGRLILGCSSDRISYNVYEILPNAFPCHVDKMIIPGQVAELYIDAFRDCDTLVIEGKPQFSQGYNNAYGYDNSISIEPRYGEVYLPVEAYGYFTSKYSEYVTGNLHPFLSNNSSYTFCLPYIDMGWEGKKSMWFKVPTGWKAYIPLYKYGNVVMKNVDTVISGEGVVILSPPWDGSSDFEDMYANLVVHISNNQNDEDEYYDEDTFKGNLLRSYMDKTGNIDPYPYIQYDYDDDGYYNERYYYLSSFYKVPPYDEEGRNYRFNEYNLRDSTFQFKKIESSYDDPNYYHMGIFDCYMSIPALTGLPNIIKGIIDDGSSAKSITIDVTDEFTYYTDEAPHVENATVVVYEKDSMKEIQRGITGKDGKVSFENLPIGDYIIHVEADEHESKDYEYHREEDKDETVEVTISYTGGVTCEFVVEETSEPDLYNLSVNYTYAVDIPIPFVSLSVPSRINVDDMAVGESIEFQARLYNNGYIRVNDVALLLPDNIPFMSFVPQQAYQGLSIEAKQSVTITVKATKTAVGDCKTALWGAAWSYPVGESTAYKNYHNIRMSMGTCPINLNEVNAIVQSNDYIGSQSTVSYQAIDGKKTENVSTDKPYITVSVDVEIDQALSLTRQAFRGTMTMKNTFPASLGDIKDILFNLDIIDTETGEKVIDKEFEVQLEKLSGFSGEESMNGPWSLASGKQGEVSVLMIPTKYAAPTKPKTYKLLPSISYIDPLLSMANPDEGRKEENLIPKTITVNPTPQLVLEYFIPKKIVGDDPMTEDVVEDSEPAELALLIRNEGYGEAKNLKITTKQPEIVDNRDGLLIDFAITGGTVNGKPVGLTEDKELVSDFGTLKAQSTGYAQWWLTSTLLGRITKYDVSYFHETGYGNENLSLLNAVNVHSLVRSIKKDKSLFGFLTDDEETSEYHFYGADGSVEDVQRVDDIDVTKKNQYSYIVSFVATESGYIYGYIQDPTDGEGKLKGGNLIDYWWESVKFGNEAPARWMKAPAMHEKTIHFVCRVPKANQAYELTLDLDDPESINSVVISSEKDEWFTLSGLRVSKPNAKGVYIHNGRKVFVR